MAQEPAVEFLWDRQRIVLADTEDDTHVWLTKFDDGRVQIEAADLWVEINAEQAAVLVAWLQEKK